MRMIVPIDTSFLIDLRKFDKHCRALGQHAPESPHPQNGLKFQLQQGATLLLPNDVLEDITFQYDREHSGKGTQQGLGRDAQGHAYLDAPQLRQHQLTYPINAKFLNFLTTCSDQGKVRCFDSPQAFYAAEEAGELEGKIAVVSPVPVALGNGTHPVDKVHRLPHEKDILKIIDHRGASAAQHCFLTSSAALATAFRERYPNPTTTNRPLILFVSAYLDLIKKLGFDPQIEDFIATADQLRDDPELRAHIHIGQKPNDSLHRAMDSFISYCDPSAKVGKCRVFPLNQTNHLDQKKPGFQAGV